MQSAAGCHSMHFERHTDNFLWHLTTRKFRCNGKNFGVVWAQAKSSATIEQRRPHISRWRGHPRACRHAAVPPIQTPRSDEILQARQVCCARFESHNLWVKAYFKQCKRDLGKRNINTTIHPLCPSSTDGHWTKESSNEPTHSCGNKGTILPIILSKTNAPQAKKIPNKSKQQDLNEVARKPVSIVSELLLSSLGFPRTV